MTTKELKDFRQMLEEKQDELSERIQRTRDRLAIVERGDTLDRVRHINDREFAVRDLNVEIRLLKGVQEALREIQAGTFGRCAECGDRIPICRLRAVPWSPYCVRCQEIAESPGGFDGQQYYAQAG